MSASDPKPHLGGPDRPPSLVLPEGLEAGLIAGIAVAAVFFVRDAWIGEPFHTPSVLGTLLFEGFDAARDVRSSPAAAGGYHLVHFASWTLVGFLASYLARQVERGRGSRFLPFAAAGALVLALLGIDALVIRTGLTRPHLWLGGLAGFCALTAYLAWRHPGAVARVRGSR
jgi:hypothetical protein